jgi:DNA-binding response OmpR family regulator
MALIARIQAHIKQFRRLTRFFGYIKTRDLVIEALSRRVYINDIEVNLTFKEFDILLYMAQRPNSAVTREELYTAVWSQKLIQGYADTITTYIMRLRQKIEVDPDNPKYLETIWGVGYRFVL